MEWVLVFTRQGCTAD